MEEGEQVNILITGGKGQLGEELARQLSPLYCVQVLGKEQMDITRLKQVETAVFTFKPDVIIHAAAFTEVEECEKQRKRAFEVNGLGTSFVVQAAKEVQARVIYISTDYVFDGKKKTPYKEGDEPNPLSIYGLSKWMGEKFVLSYKHGTVVRTSWLYGHEGKNFVKTILNRAEKRQPVQVVNDQRGSPTYVHDLVQVITQLLKKENGIYHVSNTGSCTWYEFAKAILELAGWDPALVNPISTEQYPSTVPRPKYSVLDHQSLVKADIPLLRPWHEALKDFFQKEEIHR